jgi:hypothetical protein
MNARRGGNTDFESRRPILTLGSLDAKVPWGLKPSSPLGGEDTGDPSTYSGSSRAESGDEGVVVAGFLTGRSSVGDQQR